MRFSVSETSFFYISKMKRILIWGIALILLNSCATIIGGAKYKAQFNVNNNNDAKIYYNGKYINNNSKILIKRKDANKITIKVEKDGHKTEFFHFRKISFRGGAFTSSLLFSLITTYEDNGRSRVVPIQIIIDLLNYSSLFKPDRNEQGVSKINYKNYVYNLDYKATPINPPKKEPVITKSVEKDEYSTMTKKLKDLKKLHEEGIINDEEYDHLKKKVIGMDINSSIKKDSTNTLKPVETIEKKQDVKVEVKEEQKTEPVDKPIESEEKKLSEEDQAKLDDLNKMKELGIISESEYLEMKDKLIDNK